jgi:hypothetical protein
MNTQLTNHFLGITYRAEEMHEVSHANIIPALNSHFGHQWAWEITDEKLIMDGTMVSTTVAVYIPGRVLTGRSLAKIKDYEENYLRALVNACSVITAQTMQSKPATPVAPTNAQMTPDQIMSMVGNQAPAAPVAPAPKDEVPFDDYSDLPFTMGPDVCPSQPVMPQQNVAPAPQQPPVDSAYMQPNPALNGYSQCQVDRMNRVKQALDIINDTMLGNWISTWNSAFTSKKDLNPMNIDKFLDWAEDFAKNM